MSDPFEVLRSSARAAALPSAADVRRRGHRRVVRVRAAGAVGAVLVVTAGTGVAVAVQGNGSSPALPGVSPSTTQVMIPRLLVPPTTSAPSIAPPPQLRATLPPAPMTTHPPMVGETTLPPAVETTVPTAVPTTTGLPPRLTTAPRTPR